MSSQGKVGTEISNLLETNICCCNVMQWRKYSKQLRKTERFLVLAAQTRPSEEQYLLGQQLIATTIRLFIASVVGTQHELLFIYYESVIH